MLYGHAWRQSQHAYRIQHMRCFAVRGHTSAVTSDAETVPRHAMTTRRLIFRSKVGVFCSMQWINPYKLSFIPGNKSFDSAIAPPLYPQWSHVIDVSRLEPWNDAFETSNPGCSNNRSVNFLAGETTLVEPHTFWWIHRLQTKGVLSSWARKKHATWKWTNPTQLKFKRKNCS